jgi:hypothetical protein
MSSFLSNFKTKRRLISCLREYTKETFFYKILNLGIRLFQNPQELVYCRLPFSHIFWSIKYVYHKHKKVIFHKKNERNYERTIKLYRGCNLS